MANSTKATAGTNATALEYNALREDMFTGWVAPHYLTGSVATIESWTYSTVTGQVATVTVTSDARTRFEVGMKVRLKQGGAYKYFKMTAVNDTTVEITGGSLYSLTNAAITDLYVSQAVYPVDWPFDQEILFTDVDASTITFDRNASKLHQVTLGGNRTLAISNMKVGDAIFISLIQDGTGSRTVTWFSTIKWPGNNTPILTTTASKTDVFVFVCTAANTYLGFIAAQNQ